METLFTWLTAHWALVLLFLKSGADLAFAVKPGLDIPGGVIDYLYQKLFGTTPPKS